MTQTPTTSITITTNKAERRYSGVASRYEVMVRGRMGAHRSPQMWLDRGTHADLRAANTAADRAANEPGAIAVQITEINEPGHSRMPLIMDASQDYGWDGSARQTMRIVTRDTERS